MITHVSEQLEGCIQARHRTEFRHRNVMTIFNRSREFSDSIVIFIGIIDMYLVRNDTIPLGSILTLAALYMKASK